MNGEQHQSWTMTDDECREALLQAATTEEADRFFGQFQYVQDLRSGDHSAALSKGLGLLAQCQQISPEGYERIHKGTPYYWLGTAAFLMHDYETATFFYDACVSEDLRSGADPVRRSTPGLHFIQIEGEQTAQAAVGLVRQTQAIVERAIEVYNARPGRSAPSPPLQLTEVRDRFLRAALSPGGDRLRTLATVFISFFLEWDYRALLIRIRVGTGTSEPFFLHLFKGCLLFESLLKANPTNPPINIATLRPVLRHLHTELSIPHNLSIGATDFPTVLRLLPAVDDSITSAVEFTGKLRNTVGHDLGWQTCLDLDTYNRLAAMVASSCLHAIACLYR